MMLRTSNAEDEVNLLDQRKNKRSERGQILTLLAILIPLLIVFVGLAIDFGLAYVTKTTLSKSVDAASLAAMRDLSQGETAATAAAQSAFTANYQSVPGLGTTPTPTITWFTSSPCLSGNTCVTISATATINTYFLRALSILPGVGSSFNSSTITISATAQRNPLVMSLVLDKSGSMTKNGGSGALPTAVQNFISGFDESVDNIAEISFSSVDSVDVPMTTTFMSPINAEMEKIAFGGGTFAQAGLQDGFNQILSVAPSPNIVRVAVFFTDGWANTNGLVTNSTSSTASTTHDVLNCTGSKSKPSNTPMNYGGCSPVEESIGWCSGVSFMDPTSGNTTNCANATTFTAMDGGGSESLTETNITNDATYRTEQLAEVMRNSTNNITIYSIGLGDNINVAYLQNLANDSGVADKSEPEGSEVNASCASVTNCPELTALFQTIESKILLRLSQ
jgi:Flp pilus assembly protein TadG